MHRSASILLPVFVLALTACGKGDTPGKAETEGAPAAGAPGGGTAATTIHLVIGGGPHAGTYDATSSDITCTYGYAGPGSWGNQYSVTGKKPSEFSSLQLIVPDTKDAADGTGKFLLTVAFGELMQAGYTDHTISTTKDNKEGSGTITVDDKGKTGKVSFKGKAGDGTALEGTIDCHQMMRSGD